MGRGWVGRSASATSSTMSPTGSQASPLPSALAGALAMLWIRLAYIEGQGPNIAFGLLRK
jgi:hypothetical protein